MDICFVADNNYKRFLKDYSPKQMSEIGSGDILDEDGDDEDLSGEGDITDEEKEALLKRGSVASGGRVDKRGRKHHVTGTQSSTILAPSGPR